MTSPSYPAYLRSRPPPPSNTNNKERRCHVFEMRRSRRHLSERHIANESMRDALSLSTPSEANWDAAAARRPVLGTQPNGINHGRNESDIIFT